MGLRLHTLIAPHTPSTGGRLVTLKLPLNSFIPTKPGVEQDSFLRLLGLPHCLVKYGKQLFFRTLN